jgi:hypothetical protein
MKGLAAAAVGAIWLFVLGGCVTPAEAPVSALPYVDDLRTPPSTARVTVDLKEIVTP